MKPQMRFTATVSMEDFSYITEAIKEAKGKIVEVAIEGSAPAKKAITRKRLTKKDAQAVLAYAKKHPKARNKEIAEATGVTSGSVHRILNGTASILKPRT